MPKFDFGALPAKIGKGLQKVFGSANERELDKLKPTVKKINELEDWAKGLDRPAILERVSEWRDKVQRGDASLDDALPEMFAMTRVASERTNGERHYDVQLIGGMVLHQGKIAEMVTGEGKTLVATLPLALNALEGKGVYLVTVNDYLARRDCEWMRPVFEYLGLTVGAIQSDMSASDRQGMYACDITYGTNNEFGFDYLRDNMKVRVEDQVQKNLNYAIIDEVDSILVDEARTPLIISGAPEDHTDKYMMAERIARNLKEGEDFEVKLKEQQALMLESGIEKAEKMVGVDSFYSDPKHMDWPHLLEQALRAHHIYKLDKDYVVKDGEVIIVDEFTGRLMAGRRWSDGLHQAVEAKEGLPPKQENPTLATITLQNYFRLFNKLAGMTGTAMTEASEFQKIYKLEVLSIPTNRPLVREDLDDLVYLNEDDKYDAIVGDIQEKAVEGRPVLIGTTSIEKSEKLSRRLSKANIKHDVLNAKHHEREADIVAGAGQRGSVVVATNMAGRGTDIKLGDGVRDAGGLHIVGTERHESRRIDNQLRGRCGRQGDPGSTRFYLSFDDDLMRIFARDWVKTVMEKLGLKPGEAIESPMVTRGLARAQKKVEQRNFDIRKNLLEYDEVMDEQRKFIYRERQEVLEGVGLDDKLLGMYDDELGRQLELVAGDPDQPVDTKALEDWMRHKVGPEAPLPDLDAIHRDNLDAELTAYFEKAYEARKAQFEAEDFVQLQRFLLLDAIDTKWKDHLRAMEHLKTGIGLRGYAQVDPKNEYKKEGFKKFEMLQRAVAQQITDLFFRVDLKPAEMELEDHYQEDPTAMMPGIPYSEDPEEMRAILEAMAAAGQLPPELQAALAEGGQLVIEGQDGTPVQTIGGTPPAEEATAEVADAPEPAAEPAPQAAPQDSVATMPKVGRNEPCPCGSGKKFKKCHGANA